VHVDGAFGMWAAASPRLRSLVAGADGADSWAIDGHKWLNVPYDCGLAIVADTEAHATAMSAAADYLVGSDDIMTRTPEMSRRGRAVPVYAALRHLGREGIAALVDRCCDHATRLAAAMEELDGAEVLNDVVLNQVLVRFDDDDSRTTAVVEGVQRGGEAWLGGTVWHGKGAARVSFSNWSTTGEDVDRLAGALATALSEARTAAPVR
jgi:glutamate/tyrosine decarboxylase-like PLP-dependent enzyme